MKIHIPAYANIKHYDDANYRKGKKMMIKAKLRSSLQR